MPYRCPVCIGVGHVNDGFYGTPTPAGTFETCRSCKGAGIVWRNWYDANPNGDPGVI